VNLPNLISLARLLAVPFIVWLLLTDAWAGAFVAFVIAGVSDAVDGYLAKRFDLRSYVGAYLDPIADKTLLVSIYLTLGVKGVLPLWLVILVVSRDILIVGGALLLFLLNHATRIRPSYISKLNTVLQITLAAMVIGAFAFGLEELRVPIVVLGFGVALSTTVSGAGYLIAWTRRVADMESAS